MIHCKLSTTLLVHCSESTSRIAADMLCMDKIISMDVLRLETTPFYQSRTFYYFRVFHLTSNTCTVNTESSGHHFPVFVTVFNITERNLNRDVINSSFMEYVFLSMEQI